MRATLVILAAGGCFALGFSLGMPDAESADSRRRTASSQTTAAAEPKRSPQSGAKESGLPPSMPGPVGLDGLLHLALGEGPIAREATMIQSLQPLGREQWAALFGKLAARMRGDDSTTILRRALLRLWAAAAPEEALRAIVRHPRIGARADAEAEIIVRNLAAQGFDQTADILRNLPRAAVSGAWQALGAWCIEHDPARVTEALAGWTSTAGREAALNVSLMESWIRRDRAAATAWLDSLGSSRLALQLRTSFCDALMQTSVAAAEEWVASITDAQQREEMLKHFLSGVIRRAPVEQAADYLRSNFVPNTGRSSSLAERWAASDSDAAMAWALALPAGEDRSSALSAWAATMTTGLSTWAEAEAVAAGMPDEESRRECMKRALSNLPPAEVAAHLDVATGTQRYLALRHALTGEPPLPLEQALALAPEYLALSSDGAGELASRVFDESGPQAALAWVATLPDKAAVQGQNMVCFEWSHGEPAAAAAEAIQLPESASRETVLQLVSGEWAVDDAAAATAWLAELPPGADRDAAAAGMARVISSVDPDGGLAWAATISDPRRRGEVLRSVRPPKYVPVTERWRAAVEAAPLSREEKAALLTE